MLLYALIPVVASLAGALFTLTKPPGPKLTSAIQHMAAGIVFAAAAGELLPDAVRRGTIWPVLAGASAGVLAMLFTRALESKSSGPVGLIGASAVDALIDGMVLGLGFAAGQRQGLLLAVALAFEFLLLSVSIASAFDRKACRSLIVGATLGVSLMVPIGSLVAGPISRAPAFLQTAAYAFGLIALLYLAVEELMVEAHEVDDTLWITALFFVGFIGLTILNQALG